MPPTASSLARGSTRSGWPSAAVSSPGTGGGGSRPQEWFSTRRRCVAPQHERTARLIIIRTTVSRGCTSERGSIITSTTAVEAPRAIGAVGFVTPHHPSLRRRGTRNGGRGSAAGGSRFPGQRRQASASALARSPSTWARGSSWHSGMRRRGSPHTRRHSKLRVGQMRVGGGVGGGVDRR